MACAVLAVIFNAVAIGMASRAAAYSLGVATLRNEKPNRTSMMLVQARSEERAANGVIGNAGTPADTTFKVDTPPRARPPLRTARTTPSIPNTASPTPVLFYTYEEVDSPAFPPNDWNLDIESLDTIGVQRLVFEILVSDHGNVVGCTVLEPADLSDGVKRSLEKRLSETPLLPALRAGQLVASMRRIELTVADTAPDIQVGAPAHHP